MYYIWEILFTCIHIHEQVIILIKLYIEPPEYLYVHVLYIQVTQINTSTTLCSSRKRIKYLCIFRYLNSGLTTCIESSYWKFKKWVHVIDHKQFSISKDVEEMLRVHGREGFGGEGGGGQKYFCITVVQHVQSYVSLSLIIIKRAFFYLSK